MSISSAETPTLSIVVASNGAAGSLEPCLAALEGQVHGAEVLVCGPQPDESALRDRFPFARFLEPREALVPELWQEGIDAAGGEAVALTISPMRAAPDWVSTMRRLLTEADAVGGAIDPAEGLRIRDAAEYFCRYARDMRPFEAHTCLELPGDNAGYRREALDSVRESYRTGFWEPDVHRALRARGRRLWHSPELVSFQGPSGGVAAFTRQRLRHGRVFGRERGARATATRNVAGVLGAPLVPLVMTFRVMREVARKRRHRALLVAALPLVVWFNAAWAAGEARGQLDRLARA